MDKEYELTTLLKIVLGLDVPSGLNANEHDRELAHVPRRRRRRGPRVHPAAQSLSHAQEASDKRVASQQRCVDDDRAREEEAEEVYLLSRKTVIIHLLRELNGISKSFSNLSFSFGHTSSPTPMGRHC